MTGMWVAEMWTPTGKGGSQVTYRALPVPDFKVRSLRRIISGATFEILIPARTEGRVRWEHAGYCMCKACLNDRETKPLRNRPRRFETQAGPTCD